MTPQAIMIIGLIAHAFPPEKTDARPFNRSNDFRSDIAVHNTGKCGVPLRVLSEARLFAKKCLPRLTFFARHST